jgi:hypothetical protein
MSTVYSAILFLAYGNAKEFFHTPGELFTIREMIIIGSIAGTASALTESPIDLVLGIYFLTESKSPDKIQNADSSWGVSARQRTFQRFHGLCHSSR